MTTITATLMLSTHDDKDVEEHKKYRVEADYSGQYTDTFYTNDRFVVFINQRDQTIIIPFESIDRIISNY